MIARIVVTARITGAVALALSVVAALPLRAAVVLPIERPWLGLPQVEATLNGQVTGRFIIDTAASETVLTDRTIARLGLRRGEAAEVTGTTGRAALERYRLDRLALGGRSYSDLGAYSFPRLSAPVEADGLIGADILRRQSVEFDMPRARIVLHDRNPELARPADGWLEIPADVQRNGFMLVDVRIGGLTMPALIDTGATQNFVNLAAARQMGLRVVSDSASRASVTGASGHVQPMNQFDLSGFEIAGMRFGAMRLGVADLALFDALGFGNRPAMILSLEALADRRFVLDYPKRRMLIAQ